MNVNKFTVYNALSANSKLNPLSTIPLKQSQNIHKKFYTVFVTFIIKQNFKNSIKIMLKQYDMELSLQTPKFIPDVWKLVFHKALFSVTHYKKDIVLNKCDTGASSSPAANQASDTHCQGIPSHCSQQTMCILLTFHPEVPHISQTMIWTQHYIDDSSSNEAWKAFSMMDIYVKYLKCPKYDLLFNRMTYKRKHFGQGEKACIWSFIVHWKQIQNPLPACWVCHRINVVPLFTHLMGFCNTLSPAGASNQIPSILYPNKRLNNHVVEHIRD